MSTCLPLLNCSDYSWLMAQSLSFWKLSVNGYWRNAHVLLHQEPPLFIFFRGLDVTDDSWLFFINCVSCIQVEIDLLQSLKLLAQYHKDLNNQGNFWIIWMHWAEIKMLKCFILLSLKSYLFMPCSALCIHVLYV